MNAFEMNELARKTFSLGDKNKAFDLFLKAAENGSRDAMFNVAMCYHDGIGVSVNFKLAEKWLTKASLLGDEQAKRLLKDRSLW